MTDYHIHIGQFYERYYDAHEVFSAIEQVTEKTGVNEVWYSSTSSCRYDVELFRIEEEIEYAQKFQSSILKVKPYFWAVPAYFENRMNFEDAMEKINYCGIKIHPFAHKWNLKSAVHRKALEQIFSYSEKHQKSILIHTDGSDSCLPNRFESFFKNFPNAPIILAHCAPLKNTVEMLRKYPQIKADISVVESENISKMISDGLKHKLLFGTDFPVTHYGAEKKVSLAQQYEIDCKNLQMII